MSIGAVYVLNIAKNPLSLNARDHWSVKARHTKVWRNWAKGQAHEFPPVDAVNVRLTWFVTDKRRRDEDNLVPLLKALCDGLVDAGVVADDTPDLMGKRARIRPAPVGTKTAYMELLIEAREAGVS